MPVTPCQIGDMSVEKFNKEIAPEELRLFGDYAEHLKSTGVKPKDIPARIAKDFGMPQEHVASAYKRAQQMGRYGTQLQNRIQMYHDKIAAGDFTKARSIKTDIDTRLFEMKGELQRTKNQFDRGVAKENFKNRSPWEKFWDGFVGIERAFKLSSPAVVEKLGVAAVAREALAPIESAGGYAVSKVLPGLAKGTKYGASLKGIASAEAQAKAAFFTQGMKDAFENLKGKETTLDAMSDKYGKTPSSWYDYMGKVHAAIKAPVKRAEFTRSLAQRIDAATRAGEDVNRPQVTQRLMNEAALDANREIFQAPTPIASRVFGAMGRTGKFLFPVTKVPINLAKELFNYHVGTPVGLARAAGAYMKGVESLAPLQREAIIRQITKGSVGGAALLYGYYGNDKVHDFITKGPKWLQHTPFAIAVKEGSLLRQLQGGDRQAPRELAYLGKTSIPFAYTLTDLSKVLDPNNPHGFRDYVYGMTASTAVPQAVSWVAKETDKPTPFNPFKQGPYRKPETLPQAIEQDIPGLRQNVPIKTGRIQTIGTRVRNVSPVPSGVKRGP